jgi:hypothetical protein
MGLLQLQLLLWKNFVLKKRRPVAFFVEAFLPLLLFLLLAWARTRSNSTTINASECLLCLLSFGHMALREREQKRCAVFFFCLFLTWDFAVLRLPPSPPI